jgi:hypothetical protein
MGDAETRQMQTDEPLHSFPCPLAATTLTPPTRKGRKGKAKGDILLYLGAGFVNQRGCHEHREHHEVGLFTMS